MVLQKRMFARITGLFVACLLLFALLPVGALPAVSAGESVLVDFSTGQVLYDGSMDSTITPSGLVKVMTAVLALESGYSETDTMHVTATALEPLGSAYRNMNLYVGETVTMGDLLNGMILNSANDAANVLAESVAGSVDAFVAMMNSKADELGMTCTDFVNPNGLSEDGQVSTCHDMALLLRYALSNPQFSALFGRQEATVSETDYNVEARTYNTRCALNRNGSDYYYEGVIGGVIGYGNNAYITAVAATKDSRTVIAVVAGAESESSMYADAAALLNYGFDNYTEVSFSGSEFSSGVLPVTENGIKVGTVTFSVASDTVTVLLSNDRSSDYVQIVCPELPDHVDKNSDMTYYGDICYNDGTVDEVLVYDVLLAASVTMDPVQTESTEYTGSIVTDGSGNPVTDENGSLVTGTSGTEAAGGRSGFAKFILLFLKVALIILAILASSILAFFLVLLVIRFTRQIIRRRKKAKAHARRVQAAEEARQKAAEAQKNRSGFHTDNFS